MRGTPEEFRRLVSEARWDHAIALLRWFEPSDGAEAFKSLPAEEQEALFRALPVDLAAALVESLPYYQAYVLLRSRPVDEVTAVLDALSPFARLQLFEELSGDAWRQLVQGAGEGSPQVARSQERARAHAAAPRLSIAHRLCAGAAGALSGDPRRARGVNRIVEP